MKEKSFTALGIDVGGTKIAAGIVTFPGGQIIAQQLIPTKPGRGSETVLADVVLLAEELAGKAEIAGKKIRGAGIGLCELVDPAGRILSANCIHWNERQVAEKLLHVAPITIEADVRAAALAEALLGAGRPFKLFLYVTVGTGISSCLVIEGEPYVGARGATGTMASSPLNWPCIKCGQLNESTLEEIAAGPGLVACFNRRQPQTASTGLDIVAAAASDNRDAVDVLRSGGETLGSAVGWLVNVLDPEAVIVGGSIGLSKGPYWESFVNSTRRHIWSDVHRQLPILQAATGQAAGIIGAAAAVWKRTSLN